MTPEAIAAAIKGGRCKVLTALLDGGGDPNAIPKALYSPRFSTRGPLTTPVAVRREAPDVPGRANRPTRRLASIGRDPRKLSPNEMYPVDYAASLFAETLDKQVETRKTCEEVIMILLAHGADPTRTYLDGTISIVGRITWDGRRVDSLLALLGREE